MNKIEGLKTLIEALSTAQDIWHAHLGRKEHVEDRKRMAEAARKPPNQETCQERFARLVDEAAAKLKRGEAVTFPPLPDADIACSNFSSTWYSDCVDYAERCAAIKRAR